MRDPDRKLSVNLTRNHLRLIKKIVQVQEQTNLYKLRTNSEQIFTNSECKYLCGLIDPSIAFLKNNWFFLPQACFVSFVFRYIREPEVAL